MSNRSRIKRLIKELSTNPDLGDDIVETLKKWEEEDERASKGKHESGQPSETSEGVRKHRRGKKSEDTLD